jgi:ankyrin repeat protein
MDGANLFNAIEEGDMTAIRELLSATPSLLEAVNQYGFTPLMSAVSRMERTPELVQTLIEFGANVNAKSSEGYTALHMMIDVNGPSGTGEMPGKIARLLVDTGADTEVRQHWGWTPLMRAVVEGTDDELRALVAVGGDVNKSFPNHTLPESLCGRTTLMAAIGEPAKVRILIDAGAKLSAVDAHGQTALEYAQQCLAEANGNGVDVRQLVNENLNESLLTVLKQMHDSGVDPDAPFDDEATTLRQSLEAAMRDASLRVEPFDYHAEVRESIRLLEAAVARA